MNSPEQIKQRLTDAGLKATHQRIVVFSELMNNNSHPSAEKVFENIREANPSLSLATVYKTLDAFAESGLIRKVATPKGTMRYDPEISEHHHIYCSNNDEIIDFKDEDLNVLLNEYLERMNIKNFEIDVIRIHISGKKIDPEKDIDFN